jgi:capsular polysaccharide biosynthesis protein
MYGLIGIFLAITVSSGTVFALEYFDPSFRTPADVEEFSNRPVLAAVPDENEGLRLSSSRGQSAAI